jgi:putative nucleotidyltransferase with HDIG domain
MARDATQSRPSPAPSPAKPATGPRFRDRRRAAKDGPSSADGRPRGHGKRLLDALAAYERFPALAYSRDRLLRVLNADTVSARQTVAVIESDPALAIGALRLANRGRSKGAQAICGIPDAVAATPPGALHALALDVPVFDFFGQRDHWSTAAQHFRVHAVATLSATERLILDGLAEKPDELRVAALLHDIGKLVVLQSYGRYDTGTEGPACDRLLQERRTWGLDHAVVGGVLARRLGLPNRIATLIERHHADEEEAGDATLLRLADLLVHYSAGNPVDRTELLAVSQPCGLQGTLLDALLYEFPKGAAKARPIEPSPLTARQTTIMRLLARGKVYEQIAEELGVCTSTIRSHLHSVYTKLGVFDRAQAVLLATERGWLS